MVTVRTIRTSPLAQPTLMDVPPAEEGWPALQIVRPHRVLDTIRIERLILHALDNQRGDPELVDAPAELMDEAKAFFAEHISAASDRAEWGAEFTDPDSEVPAQCLRLLGTRDQFVDASKALARRLFEKMQARPNNISPGDFVAIVYSSGQDSTRRVALLKLELDSRWARTFSGPAGRRRVRITIAKNLFAGTKRLQKCALLTPIGDPSAEGGAGFEITLLDTQAGSPRAEGIPGFFYPGFLAADPGQTPRPPNPRVFGTPPPLPPAQHTAL